MVGPDLARLRADVGAHASPASRCCCSRMRCKQALAALHASADRGAVCSMPRRERLGEAEVQAFETEGLIGAGAAPAVLAYLFHRIEDRFDGRPTLLIVDEGWLALDDPGFAGAAPRMAEDAAEEERERHLRHAVARRHRRQHHRAGHHRELPDADFAAE